MTTTKYYKKLHYRQIFNDLEQPLTHFSRSRHSLTLNIWQTAKDTAMWP